MTFAVQSPIRRIPVTLLMDGALERIDAAREYSWDREPQETHRLRQSAVIIIGELRAGLEPVGRKLALAKARAMRWVEVARQDKRPRPFAESMMEQFPLDSAQGRAMMSLAEALLRTPDPARADQLIADALDECPNTFLLSHRD